jgi:hypothetical protein
MNGSGALSLFIPAQRQPSKHKTLQQRPTMPVDDPLAPRLNRMKLLIASVCCFLVASALLGWLIEPSIE